MKPTYLFIILSSLLLFSSCSWISKGFRKEITVENLEEFEDSSLYELSYTCNCEDLASEGFLPLNSPTIKTNIYSQTIIKVERKGYIPQYITVPKRTNPFAVADIFVGGAGLAASGFFAIKGAKESDLGMEKTFTLGVIGLTSVGLMGNGIGSRKINVKRMTLNPELTPFPEKNDSIKFMEINNLDFSVEDYSIYIYEDIHKYFKEKTSMGVTRKIDPSKYQANYVLNNFLLKSGFIDTLNVLKSVNNSILLDATISKFTIHKINEEDLAAFEFTIDWTFKDVLSEKVLAEETTNYTSHLLVYKSNFNRDYFENIIINSFTELINRPSVSKIIKSENDQDNSNYDLLEIVQSSPSYAKNLTELTQSSVTIKQGEYYKSGVIISSDGFILTELGKLQNSEDSIEVILSNNSSFYGKIVRFSRKANLALIKINKNNLTPIRVIDNSNLEKLRTGQKVYSIGVTGNIQLGQSLSNGVISGIREIDQRKYIQSDIKVSESSIGSPLINEDFEFIGILTSNLFDDQVEGINFATPIDIVEKSLNISIIK